MISLSKKSWFYKILVAFDVIERYEDEISLCTIVWGTLKIFLLVTAALFFGSLLIAAAIVLLISPPIYAFYLNDLLSLGEKSEAFFRAPAYVGAFIYLTGLISFYIEKARKQANVFNLNAISSIWGAVTGKFCVKVNIVNE